MKNENLSSIGYKILSREDLKSNVPAAFAEHPHPDRTDRYSFISTIDLLDTFEKIGWTPYSAKQHGQNEYGRHIIRLSNPDFGYLPIKGDQVKPHILLDNSHDGYTPATLHLGLFRLVCSNGLVVAIPGMSTEIKFRHINMDKAELIRILSETAEQYRGVASHISNMQQRVLTNDEREQFVIKALGLREPESFLKEDKSIDLSVLTGSLNPKTLLEATRPEDNSSDLWTTFNLIQEKTVKGLYERKSRTGRKSSPRELTNLARNLEFNKKLWGIAEEFLGAPSEIILPSEKKTYTSSKGKSFPVEIIENLGGGRIQVRSESSKLIFVAAETQLS